MGSHCGVEVAAHLDQPPCYLINELSPRVYALPPEHSPPVARLLHLFKHLPSQSELVSDVVQLVELAVNVILDRLCMMLPLELGPECGSCAEDILLFLHQEIKFND